MIKTNLPVILLNEFILLPAQEARVELSNPISKKVIDISKLYHDNEVLIVCPFNSLEEEPDTSDLPRIGVIGKIKSCIDLPNGALRVMVSGIERVKVYNYVNYSNDKDVLESIVAPVAIIEPDEIEETAILRKLMNELDKFITTSSNISNSILSQIKGIVDLNKITDMIANFLPLTFEKKFHLMQEISPINRAKYLIREMSIESAINELEDILDKDLKQKLDEAQKEFILKEKIKVIKEELGETDNKDIEANLFLKKASDIKCPAKIKSKLEKEIEKYKMIPENSPELSVTRSYIDYLLSIPWDKRTKDVTNLSLVEQNLNKSHYGLLEVKERIIEYIAVKENYYSSKCSVLCLVGPPGVGKTTFAESIAQALNKKFVKVSLGGLNDTAEILGHRRTYIGSNPGKIISGLIKSGVKNPLFLLDEIDKLTKDFRGDPASALLEVLDPTQNSKFVDNYIDEEVDLSEVLFIVTANDLSSVPSALEDRLEIINITGYTEEEKFKIAKDYLIKKTFENNNIKTSDIKVLDSAIDLIISGYTKENGVRELDRQISKIIRKIITKYKLSGKKVKNVVIKKEDIVSYLGPIKYSKEKNINKSPGLVKGLACSSFGGTIIEIEASCVAGKNSIKSTGSLGNVLSESIEISLSYIKSNLDKFNLKESSFKDKDFHVNLREGAVPKDGPSAGSAITTAIISELLGVCVPFSISMSGEITLKGEILKVGGIKDKLIAAIKENITTVYLPSSNKNDIIGIDKKILEKINIKYVTNYIEIFNDIFFS